VGRAHEAVQEVEKQRGAQPAADSSAKPETKAGPELRVWKDRSARFSIEATFEAIEEGQVLLRKPDGKRTRIAMDKLSDEDQAWIERNRPQ
jgi:hypothetical protein